MHLCYQRLLTVIVLLLTVSAYSATRMLENDLVFHFNFKDSQAKKELKDLTGNYECISRNGTFEIYKGSLRTDYGAQIYIPSEKLPDISNEFTMSMWFLIMTPMYSQSRFPLLSKGILWDKVAFDFIIKGTIPEFFYSSPGQAGFPGISILGHSYGNSFRYGDDIYVAKPKNLRFPPKKWAKITLSFTANKIKIYKNGQLLIEKTNKKPAPLQNNNSPIYIGAERLKGESDNFCTSTMLINDIRLFSKAIDAATVRALYNADKTRYTEQKIQLTPTRNYYTPALRDLDYDLKKKLTITQLYEQTILPQLQKQEQVSGKVCQVNGRLALSLNNNMVYPVAGYPTMSWLNKQAVDQSFEYIRDFAAAGVNLEVLGFAGSYLMKCPDSVWPAENRYDFKKFDQIMAGLKKANPAIKIIMQLPLYPPKWFIDKYPEEFEKYYSSSTSDKLITWKHSVLSSEKWLNTMKVFIKEFIKHIELTAYSNQVFGFLISAGDAGEFYWPAAFTGGVSGYAQVTVNKFRKWLKCQYGNNIEQLRKAWNSPELTFDTAAIPKPGFRLATEHYIFRDPMTTRQVLDFRTFLCEETFKAMKTVSKTTKEASNNTKLVIVYGGYSLLFAGKSQTLHNSGMQITKNIFNCPYIDIVATPLDYVRRRGKEPGLNINPYNGSARLHKKLLWDENDLRTHVWPKITFGRTADIQETLAVIKRGFGYSITKGSGLWFLAMAGNAAFHMNDVMETIAKMKLACNASLLQDNSPVAEMAIIFDEKSTLHTAVSKGSFLDHHTWRAYEEATRCGAAADFYLLDDINNPNMPDYKLYVFLNTYYTDDAVREAIAAKVKKNNAVAVWCYAPGFVSPKGLGTDTMYDLTGIKLCEESKERTLSLKITAKDSPITKYIKNSKQYTFGPVFYADSLNANVLGTANGKPALVAKEFKNWRSVYSLMPLSKELLMGLCDYAGVHVYSRSFDIFSANKSYIMLHTSSPGDKTITLPGKHNIKEVFTNKIIGADTSVFTDKNVPVPATRIYQLEAAANQR